MESLWKDEEAKSYESDSLGLRVYTSRLLGRESSLVLHGGGNTSLKDTITNFWGEKEEILYVKGSGWDLASIEKPGFPAVKLDVLKRLAKLDKLTDAEMVKQQRIAMLDPSAPNPSVEAILHAIIPFTFVDHTHADTVVTITNNKNALKMLEGIYGDTVLIIPYTMAGFILAKKIYEMTKDIHWEKYEGMILLNHGVFSFANDAKTSYEKMIRIVTKAENYLAQKKVSVPKAEISPPVKEDLLSLASIRHWVSKIKGSPMIVKFNNSPEAKYFSNLANLDSIATRGPITPDHVIRTKLIPAIVKDDIKKDIKNYADSYQKYFARNTNGSQKCLDLAPRFVIWAKQGICSIGKSVSDANIVSDIVEHTIQAIQVGEQLGGWQALSEKDLFDMEYWELEQAKLGKSSQTPEFQGKVILVTGAASGIGRASAEYFQQNGGTVVGIDKNPEVTSIFQKQNLIGIQADVTNTKELQESVYSTVRLFGGLDIVVANAGTFPPSRSIEEMDEGIWTKSIEINLNAHQRLIKECIPFLKLGIDPSIVFIASKNVPAPGPGASAYSVAKAGMNQLARVAALELAPYKIRVNVIHPNAVFDTGIWESSVLESRAKHYGLSVEEYKKSNLLKVEITSQDVARLVGNLAGKAFSKTTGAQIPIDGGNERVI
ncbi:MAG: bifunctional aldolase/short-chain dehydrogenase [Leptospiraceae bacterium]|nr:bifunctional aldolase/short-chain dehydrogenase [Leptospiraceae bacterium]